MTAEPKWYLAEPRRLTNREGETSTDAGRPGWTTDPGYAAVSYGVGDGKGNAYPTAYTDTEEGRGTILAW